MSPQATRLPEIQRNDSGVDAGYRHSAKRFKAGKPLEPQGSVLKWYELHAEGSPVPGAVSELARAYLLRSPLEARGLGFVVLHRCGEGFYFLIVCTWRASNELWQTVFYKDGDAMADFAPFPRKAGFLPTFCVWELAPVWHEKKAWVRYLESSRDDSAAREWMSDCLSGSA